MPNKITAKYLYINGACVGRFEHLTKEEIEESFNYVNIDGIFEIIEVEEETRYKTDIGVKLRRTF